MPTTTDSEIINLLRDLFALRNLGDPDAENYGDLDSGTCAFIHENIMDELLAIVKTESTKQQLEVESSQRLHARVKAMHRNARIQELCWAKEALVLAQEYYVAAVETQAWAENGQIIVEEKEAQVAEAKEVLEARTAESEKAQELLE